MRSRIGKDDEHAELAVTRWRRWCGCRCGCSCSCRCSRGRGGRRRAYWLVAVMQPSACVYYQFSPVSAVSGETEGSGDTYGRVTTAHRPVRDQWISTWKG